MPEHISMSDAVASIRDIAAHYEMSELAIGDFFDLVLKGQSPHLHLFVSESRKDIKLLSQVRLAENNRLASLALLTFMEAVFMADYDHRVHKRERTDLGRAFRVLNKECENNRRLGKGKASPSFQYDILELWRNKYAINSIYWFF